MGSVSCETAKLRKRVLQSGKSCVKDGRQLAKFIMGIGDRQPSSQRLCRYLSSTGCYLAHRRKRTVSDEVAASCRESHCQRQAGSKKSSKFRHSSPKLCLRAKDPQHYRPTSDPRTVF